MPISIFCSVLSSHPKRRKKKRIRFRDREYCDLYTLCFNVVVLTEMKLSNDSPYCWPNTLFISPISTSQRVTTRRIRLPSSVPKPFMLLYNCSAKKPALFLTHFTVRTLQNVLSRRHTNLTYPTKHTIYLPMASRPFLISPENSFSIASSISWPVTFWYSMNICFNCGRFLWTRIALKVDSSVPKRSSPVKYQCL